MTSPLKPIDFPFGYRGLVINRHRTAAGALDKTYELRTIRVNRFDFSRIQVRDQREPLSLLSGGDLGDATETFRYLSLSGSIIAPSGSELEDDVGQFLQTFDIEESQLQYPADKGISAFTFTCPTDIVGYTPYQIERFYARPAGYPVVIENRSSGFVKTFALELVCEDPRRHRNTETIVTINPVGHAYPAVCPNWNTAVGRYAYPVLTLTMSEVGSATFYVTDGTKTLVVDLSGCIAGDVVTIDMANGIIRKNGAYAQHLRTSAVDSFFGIPRGGATIRADGNDGGDGGPSPGGVSSVAIAYRQARA